MATERQATGCPSCNTDIAHALERMRDLPGFLSADAYARRYFDSPRPWPKPYVDDTHIPETIAVIEGEDGWLIANNCLADPLPGSSGTHAHTCDCGSDHVQHDLYRGTVTFR